MGFCNKCGEIVSGPMCKCGGETKQVDIGLDITPNQSSDAYLSLGFRGGVEAGLKTMLHGDSKVNLKCYGCTKVLVDADSVFPDPEQNLPYCEGCYSKNWSKGACKTCQKPVLGMGKEWVKEGQNLFHKQCYKAKACTKCKKDVYGGAVVVDILVLHKDCFSCEICSSGLANTQFAVKGETLVCKNCSNTINKSGGSSVNNLKTKDPKSSEKSEKSTPEPIVYRGGEGKEKCKKCNKPFSTSEQTLQFDGGMIHSSCLKCDGCHKVLDNNSGFVRAGDQLYHQSCAKVSIPDQPTCAECRQPLASAFMTFEGKKLHSKCFKCFKCGKELAKIPFGKFYDKVACEACLNQELQKEQQSRPNVHDGDRKAGFTINPITGKREVRDQVYAENLANNLEQLNVTSKSKTCPFCAKPIFPGDMVL